MRAPEVTRQQRQRVGWDATKGRNGGAERTVWETLLEMERFDHRAGEKDPGAITLVLNMAEALERVSRPVAWTSAAHLDFPRKILRVLCGYFDEHQRRVQFEGCVAEPLQTITAILPRSKWRCLLFRVALQDALSEVMKVSTPLKLNVSWTTSQPAWNIERRSWQVLQRWS